MSAFKRKFSAATSTLALAIGALTAGAPNLASARSIVPAMGYAVPMSDVSCFRPAYGAIVNDCPTMRRWEVPLVVDSSGQKNITVSVRGNTNGSQIVRCAATGVDKRAIAQYVSAWVVQPYTLGPQDISLSVSVPSGGGLYVTCEVGSGASITNVNW